MQTKENVHIAYEGYLIDNNWEGHKNEVTYKLINLGYCFKYSLDTFDSSLQLRKYLKIKNRAVKWIETSLGYKKSWGRQGFINNFGHLIGNIEYRQFF